MATFTVKETQACWVTWFCEVEASNEDEARERFMEGRFTLCEVTPNPEIGDSVGYDMELEIEKRD